MQWERHEFTITDRREDLDVALIHTFLSTTAYWARDIPREVVVRAIEHSVCFGVFRGRQQVGFGRVVTDRATFAYLADVFILESDRG